MNKTYILNVITHKMTTFKFNTEKLLLEKISSLNIPHYAKKQIIDNGHTHVSSNARANSLDVYVLNVVDDYFEESYNTKVKLDNTLDSYSDTIGKVSEGLETVNEVIKNNKIISDNRVEHILLAVYVSILNSVLDEGGYVKLGCSDAVEDFNKILLSKLAVEDSKIYKEFIKEFKKNAY